jgi:hypothetical protein
MPIERSCSLVGRHALGRVVVRIMRQRGSLRKLDRLALSPSLSTMTMAYRKSTPPCTAPFAAYLPSYCTNARVTSLHAEIESTGP